MTTPNAMLRLCQPFLGNNQRKPSGLPIYKMMPDEGEKELRRGRPSSECGLRFALGVSTKCFAEKMGVSMNYARQLLSPNNSLRPAMVQAIAETFGVPESVVLEAKK